MAKVISEDSWVALLQKIYVNDNQQSVTTTKVTIKNKVVDDAVIAIPLDKLKELHDNLMYNGFTDTEALVITAQVASGARTV